MADPPDQRADDGEPTLAELLSRRERLRAAALEAEYQTGRRERTERRANRNIVARIAIIVVGTVVLLAGLVMLVLPGPGVVAILVGLGILAQEFTWADKLLKTVRKKAKVDQVSAQPVWVRTALALVTVAAVAASIVFVAKR